MDAKDFGRSLRLAGHGLLAAAVAVAVLAARQVTASYHAAASSPAVPVVKEQPHSSVGERPPDGETTHSQPLDLTVLDDAKLARLMEDQPERVMSAIDALQDRDLALRLAVVCANAVQGPHFELLVAWARRQSDEKVAVGIYNQLMARWLGLDEKGCVAFARDSLGGDEAAMKVKDRLLRSISGERGVQMLEQLPVDQRAQLLALRPGRLACTNPEGALNAIAALPDTAIRTEAVAKLAEKWVGAADVYHRADPASAVEHIQQISDTPLRCEGFRAAAAEWGRTNPAGASRWIDGLAAGPDRDAAVQGMVQSLTATKRDKALQWAGAIGDAALRARILEQLQMP